MGISAQQVKELRTKTGAGMMDCKKALVETDGDMDKALEYLQVKGLAKAKKRADRDATEGTIGSYIHHDGKTGVMVEINCETDFVGKNEDFQEFARNVAMHIAASRPEVVSSEEVDEGERNKQFEIFQAQGRETGKPDNIVAKIAEGRLKKWLKEVSLLDQPYVKDPDKTVGQLLTETASKLGENIVIKRFARFQIG